LHAEQLTKYNYEAMGSTTFGSGFDFMVEIHILSTPCRRSLEPTHCPSRWAPEVFTGDQVARAWGWQLHL